MLQKDTKIIALTGKGGVGKTSLSAAIIKILAANYPDKKILAIDADPAVGLATALGIEPKQTVNDIRQSIISSVEEGKTSQALDLVSESRFQIYETIVETEGYAFLAIGRPESSGCYCKVNAYLKDVISMLAKDFDYVVIDGEAGIEQVNRRVMEKVTHLLLISDASKKGTQVIQTIKKVADKMVMYDEIGCIINRLPDESVKEFIDTGDIPILAYIPNDTTLATFDIQGKNITKLPEQSEVIVGVTEALRKFKLIK
ncbi:MAG: AAA family ATPase [Clostridia bacterium]